MRGIVGTSVKSSGRITREEETQGTNSSPKRLVLAPVGRQHWIAWEMDATSQDQAIAVFDSRYHAKNEHLISPQRHQELTASLASHTRFSVKVYKRGISYHACISLDVDGIDSGYLYRDHRWDAGLHHGVSCPGTQQLLEDPHDRFSLQRHIVPPPAAGIRTLYHHYAVAPTT
ncbi:hypothetical protein NX059_012221 [Plenodomus lindquistii]|nr:hypothetical protein NX059_012221 [Plenodomus lindquistii]